MHWSYVRYTVYMLLSKGGRVPPVRTYSQRLLLSTLDTLSHSAGMAARTQIQYPPAVIQPIATAEAARRDSK